MLSRIPDQMQHFLDEVAKEMSSIPDDDLDMIYVAIGFLRWEWLTELAGGYDWHLSLHGVPFLQVGDLADPMSWAIRYDTE